MLSKSCLYRCCSFIATGHNHPYESITQQDYYGLAAYFSRVKLKGKRFGLDDETVYLARTGEVKFPDTKIDVAPAAFGTPAVANASGATTSAALSPSAANHLCSRSAPNPHATSSNRRQ